MDGHARARIRRMVLGSVMKETTRILPPQFPQISGSVLKTLLIKLAHRFRRAARCLESGKGSSGSDERVPEVIVLNSTFLLRTALALEE